MNNNVSIYAKKNPYGYRYNINHPKINELYQRFKKWKKYPSNCPISDGQRFEFERYIDGLLKKKEIPTPGGECSDRV